MSWYNDRPTGDQDPGGGRYGGNYNYDPHAWEDRWREEMKRERERKEREERERRR